MPIKSQAQRRKFAALLVEGKISEEVYERWNREAGSKVLPERLHPETKTKNKARRKTTAKRSGTRKATRKRTRKTATRRRAAR
jgi:topoisomerase IA-like protein